MNRHIDGKSVLADIASASLRAAIILIPAAFAENWVRTYTVDLPDFLALILRAAAFSAAALLLLVATRSHLWFADRRLDVPPQRERTE